eukprot:PhF_6_TR25262/c2_g1_i3/m.34804
MINLNNFVLSTQSSHHPQQQQHHQLHRPVPPTMVAQPHAPTPPLFIVIQSPQQQQPPTTQQFCHSMGTPTATTTAAPMMFLQPAPASTQSSLQVSPSLSPHPLSHQHHHHHHHLPFGQQHQQQHSIFGTPTQNRSMPTTPTTTVAMPTQGLTGMCATHGKLRALSALRPHPMKPGKFVCVESNVCVRLQTRVTGASTLPTLPVNPTNNNNNNNAANPAVMKNRRFSESDKKDIVGAVSYLTLRSEEEKKKKTTHEDDDDDDDDPTAILKDFVLAMGRRHSADPSSTPEGDTLDLADDVFSKFEREYRSTTATSGDGGAVTPSSRKMSTQDPGGVGDTFNGGLKCPPPIDL